MEQGRLFLAIVLSFLVFVIWEFLFVEKKQVPPPAVPEKAIESPVQEPLDSEVKSIEQDSALDREKIADTPGTVFIKLKIQTP